jgi:hypothetical protein
MPPKKTGKSKKRDAALLGVRLCDCGCECIVLAAFTERRHKVLSTIYLTRAEALKVAENLADLVIEAPAARREWLQ